jgi:hypothetical protein
LDAFSAKACDEIGVFRKLTDSDLQNQIGIYVRSRFECVSPFWSLKTFESYPTSGLKQFWGVGCGLLRQSVHLSLLLLN